MPGFWERLEDRIIALQKDRRRMMRLFLVAYWISLGMVVLGGVLIILNYAGVWRP